MNRPMVTLPNTNLVHPYERGSMKYWEVVAELMRLTACSRESAEGFVKSQSACKEPA